MVPRRPKAFNKRVCTGINLFVEDRYISVERSTAKGYRNARPDSDGEAGFQLLSNFGQFGDQPVDPLFQLLDDVVDRAEERGPGQFGDSKMLVQAANGGQCAGEGLLRGGLVIHRRISNQL